MFTWICPKCGGEVPPAYDECPRCHPKQASSPAPVQAAVTEPVAVPHVAPPAPVVAAPPPPPPAPVYTPPVAEVPPQSPPPRRPPSAYDWEPPPPTPPPLAVGQTAYGGQTPAPRTVSPILAALGAASGVALLLALLYVFVLPHRGDSDTASVKDSKGAAAETTRLERPGSEAAAGKAHPLAKHIEVGGVRIQEQAGGKVRIDFVVVNHSAADLPQLKMDVRLVSGSREYFVIPVALPSIGPYESKDMSTSVKTDLRPYELPDWQLVQAKFAVRD